MSFSKILTIILLFLWFPLWVGWAQEEDESKKEKEKKGKLGEFQKDFKDKEKGKKKSEEDEEEEDNGWISDLIADFMVQNFYGIISALDSSNRGWYYLSYPYDGGYNFATRLDFYRDKSYFFTFGGDYQYLSRSLMGYSLAGKAKFLSRFGVDFTFDQYIEQLNGDKDRMQILSGHFLYSLLIREPVLIDVQMGFKTLSGEENFVGADFGFSGEVFPVPPWMIDASVQFASLNEKLLLELEGGVGILYGRTGFRLGFRTLRSPHHSLNSLMLGTRLWF
ncbi:hypothetical protein ISS37_00985 [candidate division KSB1 bacterium]|nr:hypothetical protein [candidate division KSB1 bacterium]